MQVSEILEMKKGIKAKLMAATSLLLVSAILLSLTTYAWFILSTAPEVTEMQTTAGANGALEIALLNAQGAVDDGTVGRSNVLVSNQLANTTWGNLVDLSEGYGIENLTLYPSRLAMVSDTSGGSGANYSIDRTKVLNYPEFGQDGRITGLQPATKAYFDGTSYSPDAGHYGVNVIGKAAGTDKKIVHLQYSRSSILEEATAKVKYYQQSLRERMVAVINDNAAGLFNLLMNASSAIQSGGKTDASINWAESYDTANDIVNRLYAMTGDEEDSLRWALLAYAASDTEHYNENIEGSMAGLGVLYNTFRSMTLYTTEEGSESVYMLATKNGYTDLADAVVALRRMEESVSSARGYLKAGKDNAPFACLCLMNINNTIIMNAGETNGGKGTLLYAAQDADGKYTGGFQYNIRNKIFNDEIYFLGPSAADAAGGKVFDNMAKIVGDFSVDVTAYATENDKFTAEPTDLRFTMTACFSSESSTDHFSEYIERSDEKHSYKAYRYNGVTYYQAEDNSWYVGGGLLQIDEEVADLLNSSLYTDGSTSDIRGATYTVYNYVNNGKTSTTYKKDGSWFTNRGRPDTAIPAEIQNRTEVVTNKSSANYSYQAADGTKYLICKYGSGTYYLKTEDPTNYVWDGKARWFEKSDKLLIPVEGTAVLAALDAGKAIPGHIGVLGNVYQAASGLQATGNVPFSYERTDMTAYGYTVDFAFRSSKSGKLLLQKLEADRVKDGQVSSSTQGGGSYVTFTVAGDMSEEDALRLIQNIHIVFMNPQTGDIYKIAVATGATMELNQATARFDLYDPVYQVSADGSVYVTCSDEPDPDGVILELTENEMALVTAVVYLNGDTVESGDFSATQGLSLNGNVNLQFASSSDLEAMDYNDYQIGYTAYTYNGEDYYLGSDGKWYDKDKNMIIEDQDAELIKKLNDHAERKQE